MLSLSFLLSFWSRRRASLRETEWLLFALGVLGTLPASITGLVAHSTYEESTLADVIRPHQLAAMLGTLAILALLVWRWRSAGAKATSPSATGTWLWRWPVWRGYLSLAAPAAALSMIMP